MIKEIKGLCKRDKRECLTDDKEIASRWVEYCSNMYKANEGEKFIEESPVIDNSCPLLLRAEVEQAIKALKKHKSPGCDEMCDGK